MDVGVFVGGLAAKELKNASSRYLVVDVIVGLWFSTAIETAEARCNDQ
jgi:hypothetical protein